MNFKKQYALIHTAYFHDYYFKYSKFYLVKMSRLLRVNRKRYSSPACMILISRPNENKLFECSIGNDWWVSLLRVNKLNGAFIPATPWYM